MKSTMTHGLLSLRRSGLMTKFAQLAATTMTASAEFMSQVFGIRLAICSANGRSSRLASADMTKVFTPLV